MADLRLPKRRERPQSIDRREALMEKRMDEACLTLLSVCLEESIGQT